MAYSVPHETAEGRALRRGAALSPGDIAGNVMTIIATVATLVFILLPIVWIALTAFKNDGDAFSLKVLFTPTLGNFRAIFETPLSFGPLLVNSLIVSLATLVIAIPLALMAAYAFSRYTFVGNTGLLIWVLATQFIPPVVVVIPFFNLFRRFGLIDTRPALVIVNLSVALPYAIWLLKGFIDTLPTEVEEAAMVDGCTELGILRHVTLPLVVPGLVVATVFCFIQAWNEFLFALILTRREAVTLQVGLLNTTGVRGVQWNQMAATGLIVMVPIFILSFAIRRYFVQGLTMGAVK